MHEIQKENAREYRLWNLFLSLYMNRYWGIQLISIVRLWVQNPFETISISLFLSFLLSIL
jgi:hypothetical protein